jgi:hypothetical protein
LHQLSYSAAPINTRPAMFLLLVARRFDTEKICDGESERDGEVGVLIYAIIVRS